MADDNQKFIDKLPSIDSKKLRRRFRKAEGATIRHARRFVFKRWSNVKEVQRDIALWVLAMGVLIGATGLQLMWSQQNYQTNAPADNSTYAEATIGPIDNLNPIYATTSAEQSAAYLMFSSLLKYDTTGRLGYDLASNIQVDSTGTRYTVTIRSDAKWHDGQQLTAKDVAFTINLLKDPDTRASGTDWSGIDIVQLNNTTVEFRLQSPYAGFEHALTFPILPEHLLGKIPAASLRESNFSQNPIGSGPFKLTLAQKDDTDSDIQVLDLTRNDNYYGQEPKLLHFQLHAYDTTSDIAQALSNNVVNAASGLSSVDLGRVDTKKYNETIQPVQSGVFALLNTKSPLLKDVNVRRGLELATDPSAVLAKLPKGTPSLDIPIIPNLLSGNIPHAQTYNKNAALKSLAAAGWQLDANKVLSKKGQAFKLTIETPKDDELERVLEVLAGQWRAIGISVDTKTFDTTDVTQNAVQSVLQPRAFDVLLYQLNIGGDADVYAYWHSSQATQTGLNFSNYSNPISDDALLSARTRSDPALRNAKYLTFVKQWLSDVPAIGLYQSTEDYVSSKSSFSFSHNNTLVSPTDRYGNIYNWAVGTDKVYKTP